MIASGEKREEYRDLKQYYDLRIKDATHVLFIAGYDKTSPQMTCEIESIRVGRGRAEWGADPQKEYYVITLKK